MMEVKRGRDRGVGKHKGVKPQRIRLARGRA